MLLCILIYISLCADDEVLVRIGIDGGGGFFKICLSIFLMTREAEKASFKDSGVKRLFILAIAADIQENYENMMKLWRGLKMHSVETPFTIATDLKLCNILLGMMAHGSSHPCCWCTATKGHLLQCGETRTLSNLTESFFSWMEDGRRPLRAKHFDNVIHPPLIRHVDQKTPVLQIIPPPELHLLTGPVNTLYNALAATWGDGCDQWINACHVQREAMHGGSFTGNSSRKLLSKVDTLQSMCPITCLPHVAAFRSFEKVNY